MSLYFLGILAAFGPPVLHGISNIIDGYLSNKVFSHRLVPLVFLTSLIGLVLMPVIWLLDAPVMLPPLFIGVTFTIALIEVAYLYPYYWSLRKIDTSIVASLFSLGRIFVPLLAFFIIGERLTLIQYGGIALIVCASIFLTLDLKKLRFNSAFFLMLFVTAILAVQAILSKYLYEAGVSWGTSVVWTAGFEFLIAGVAVLTPKNLASLVTSVQNIKSSWKLFALNEFLGWAGNMSSYLAVFLIPVSISKAIGSTQSIFVLIAALLISRKNPEVVSEYMDRASLLRKFPLFIVMALGAILVIV